MPRLKIVSICRVCGGTGTDPSYSNAACHGCDGSGEIESEIEVKRYEEVAKNKKEVMSKCQE